MEMHNYVRSEAEDDDFQINNFSDRLTIGNAL